MKDNRDFVKTANATKTFSYVYFGDTVWSAGQNIGGNCLTVNLNVNWVLKLVLGF